MVLESFCHDESLFITLTYDSEHLPFPGSLDPAHLRNFLKRLRFHFDKSFGGRLRFFGVGEYGDKSWRPHYHAILFGVGYAHVGLVERAWQDSDGESIGWVHCGDVTPESCQYVAGYTTKKMTTTHDDRLIAFRREGVNLHPEFARQSKGIGAPALPFRS